MFISTSIIKIIALQHSEYVITILIPTGSHALFINSVNDLPGGGLYGKSRQCELIIDIMDGYEKVSLDASTDYANGKWQMANGKWQMANGFAISKPY
jgi:hypothetical protein